LATPLAPVRDHPAEPARAAPDVRPARTPARTIRRCASRAARALVRAALIRFARARPRGAGPRGGEPRVVILLASAWGMGGTIRAALNLAGHLAGSHEVEILSGLRRRDAPFMGDFPAGVVVTALDDQRPGAGRGLRARLAAVLRRRGSVLVHSADVGYGGFSLWSDIQLVRRLRREGGVVIGTRPGLNILLADLALPGAVVVGQEQMHLESHSRRLRAAMGRSYGRLDALAVLTRRDLEDYRALLGGDAPRLVRIPNTVNGLALETADLDAKVVLAAGRLTGQKGFDLLIRAWSRVADEHPDWRLRIHGRGQARAALKALIAELDLAGSVELRGGAHDLGARMREASVYALSSRFEGFPLVLLEAMGQGMAVVAFDCPTGPGDVIEDGRNGLLVPHKDVDALAASLLEMIEDDGLRRSCAAAAAETACGYTIEVIGPRWEALLAELRRPTRAPGLQRRTQPARGRVVPVDLGDDARRLADALETEAA
jgi:glycosyltransferase involved in cell wall biosynthesis